MVRAQRRRSASFIDAKPYVFQNVFDGIDKTTGRPIVNENRKPNLSEQVSFCPSLWGGRDWPPEAYNPMTGYVYISANENLCQDMAGQEVEYEEGGFYTGADSTLTVREGWDHIGEVQAWDVNTGEKVWTHAFEDATTNWGQMMTDSGQPRLFRWHHRPLLPRLRRGDRRAPLAIQDELRRLRDADNLYGRRRAVHRRPVRLGRRRHPYADGVG